MQINPLLIWLAVYSFSAFCVHMLWKSSTFSIILGILAIYEPCYILYSRTVLVMVNPTGYKGFYTAFTRSP